ncbi:MAG: TlpA disulfide reductase family protein [Saprospiraceae bacterium]
MTTQFKCFLIAASLLLLSACFVVDKPFTKLPPGIWRGVLYLTENHQADQVDEKGALNKQFKFEEVSEGELPFNFEVIYTNDTTFYIEIINGSERVRCDSIIYALDRRIAKDTMQFHFPLYDSYIKATYEENDLAGEWIVNTRKDYKIKFRATYGKGYRFTDLNKTPVRNISGHWKATFGLGEDEPYPAIAEFEQKGNDLSGTFRTETGDFRFLQGTVQKDKFYLSCFDGIHAYLFEGKMMLDSSLTGIYRSGSHYRGLWGATRDPDSKLQDPGNITHVSNPEKPVEFQFLSSKGKLVNLNDSKFAGKAKIIQIMGTWCPNCLDEIRFMNEYFKAHPMPDVERIAIAFEKYPDTIKVLNHLEKYKEKLDLNYDLLFGGQSGSKNAGLALPFLDKINSFPTTLFLDKNNRVVYIHSGFDGPATSEFKSYQSKFEQVLRDIQASRK